MAGVSTPEAREAISALLAGAGFVAFEEEACELLACAGGSAQRLASLIERRLSGEPLAWITGKVLFCGREILVDPGVYVPRWQSEPLARRAVERLPAEGVAVELCTGTGAIAKVLSLERPRARVLACDADERAAACALANGVDAYLGDLFTPLPGGLEGRVDVVVAVAPYVPTSALGLLPRDTFVFESPLAYDGGPDGTAIVRRLVLDAVRFLKRGGALLLELGGEQAATLDGELARLGYVDRRHFLDEDGDVRGLEARLV
jgi:release factor glutamine methyltransferase